MVLDVGAELEELLVEGREEAVPALRDVVGREDARDHDGDVRPAGEVLGDGDDAPRTAGVSPVGRRAPVAVRQDQDRERVEAGRQELGEDETGVWAALCGLRFRGLDG